MAFLGLFVGIDRYDSPKISWLSCAKRDAAALHALFEDTLGGDSKLLTDNQATQSAIESELERLTLCREDDVVVIAFSGHGSPTHELVTYDASVYDLANSAISLDSLTEWFSRIPSRHLLCILDCCFSGGMGAKVLQVDTIPRDLLSTEEALNQLSGEGRLILTASTATEPAWENNKIGHGLLTYYLLEALQGAPEVKQAGKISVYQLLEYVTQRVIDGAEQLGQSQHPALRGKIDGELTWPVFKPGKLYRSAFPERIRQLISRELQSLTAYSFPSELIDAWGSSIPSLNQLQIDAINDFKLLDGENLVVSAPTSSGKTMVGELAAIKGTLDRKRAFFLLPLKALVNDKHQHFVRTYSKYGLRIIRATGEIIDDIPALMRGQYDICLMTYEKFAALALGSPHILDHVGTIVVDEVQMITDESRGPNLEFVLTLLRIRQQTRSGPQLIALSAVIGDTNGLERWLGARLLRHEERPVPLEEGILRADGSFRYLDSSGQEQVIEHYIQRQWGKGSSQDWIIPLAKRLVEENNQVIVFRTIRGETRGCANYLARDLGLPPAQNAIDSLPTGDPSDASNTLRNALMGGVAFHNSDLDREERQVIEEQFRAKDSTLRVITATTTLAMGVNTPAESVVIAGLEHPGPKPYSIAEYKNLVGRAGRLGYSEKGKSFLLALTPHDEHYFWNHYVCGKPEDIQSRFMTQETDVRSMIVRVLAVAQRITGKGFDENAIVNFLEGSFGAFQQKQLSHTWTWDRKHLLEALKNLESHKLVEQGEDGYYQLTSLGSLAGEGGIEVESLTRLVGALSPLTPETINDPTLIAATQLTTELDKVNFPLNKKSTQKEPQTWAGELHHQQVAPVVIQAISRSVSEQHQPTLRAKKAVACLLWITDWPIAEIERVLTQFGGAFNGAAGDIRSVATRSCDLLPAVTSVAELLHPGLDLSVRRARLLARLEVGVPAELAELAMHAGGRLTRGDYQRLKGSGIGSIASLENCSDENIISALGNTRNHVEKLSVIREAVQTFRSQEMEQNLKMPILPPYIG